MHWSVLCPVHVSEQEIADLKGAVELIKVKSAALDSAQESAENRFAAEYEKSYLNSVSTAFALAVEQAVNKAMDPYFTESEEYTIFEDHTEDARTEWETRTIDVLTSGKRHYRRYAPEVKGLIVCDDGIVREKTNPDDRQDKSVWLSARAKKFKAETIPVKEFYRNFKAYAEECYQYDKETDSWGYTTNPYAFYDSAVVGGRWKEELLVKDDAEYAIGMLFREDGNPRPAPEGYRWVSACRIKDLQPEKMLESARQEYLDGQANLRRLWKNYLAYRERGLEEEFWGEVMQEPAQNSSYTFQEDGIYRYKTTKVFDPGTDPEKIAAKMSVESVLGNVFDGFLDSDEDVSEYPYYERSDSDSSESWFEQIMDMLSDYDKNTVLVTMDCHM